MTKARCSARSCKNEMTKTLAELRSEPARLDAEIRTARKREVGDPLDQITDLMSQWSISLDDVSRHFRHRFGMEASDPELTVFLTRATVGSWLRRVRTLLWTLDPSGRYVTRVHLGQKPTRRER